mmetsp:Transcript_3202/g.10584  ORF Transcript_3202/g.10584 Transcript_3202/m.10584 type:complete len:448 (+) Transcript_3202:1745-3088(+)
MDAAGAYGTAPHPRRSLSGAAADGGVAVRCRRGRLPSPSSRRRPPLGSPRLRRSRNPLRRRRRTAVPDWPPADGDRGLDLPGPRPQVRRDPLLPVPRPQARQRTEKNTAAARARVLRGRRRLSAGERPLRRVLPRRLRPGVDDPLFGRSRPRPLTADRRCRRDPVEALDLPEDLVPPRTTLRGPRKRQPSDPPPPREAPPRARRRRRRCKRSLRRRDEDRATAGAPATETHRRARQPSHRAGPPGRAAAPPPPTGPAARPRTDRGRLAQETTATWKDTTVVPAEDAREAAPDLPESAARRRTTGTLRGVVVPEPRRRLRRSRRYFRRRGQVRLREQPGPPRRGEPRPATAPRRRPARHRHPALRGEKGGDHPMVFHQGAWAQQQQQRQRQQKRQKRRRRPAKRTARVPDRRLDPGSRSNGSQAVGAARDQLVSVSVDARRAEGRGPL